GRAPVPASPDRRGPAEAGGDRRGVLAPRAPGPERVDPRARRAPVQGKVLVPHHVSTHGRFFPVRAGGGGTERSAVVIQRRDSAGSITSSISKYVAKLTAFP